MENQASASGLVSQVNSELFSRKRTKPEIEIVRLAVMDFPLQPVGQLLIEPEHDLVREMVLQQSHIASFR